MNKKKKTLELSEFEIFEKANQGLNRSFSLYPNKPLVSISKSGIGIGAKAINVLQISDKDTIIVLKKGLVLYLATPTLDSNLSGYRMIKSGLNLHSSFNAKRRGIECGYYEVLKPIFVGGMDLFQLEKFEALIMHEIHA